MTTRSHDDELAPDVGEQVGDAAVAGTPGRRRDVARVLVTALPAFAIVVLAAARWGDAWTPSHDLALIDLRIRDVGSSDTPLLGVYSRFGWNHPGPLMFWLFAPVVRLLGGDASAGLVAAGLQNAAFVVLFGWLAHRVGGRGFHLVAGVAIAVLCASLGSETLLSTWNPWLLVLPFAVLMIATWGMASGDLALVPVVVGVASLVVQTHLGLVPLVVAIVAVGAVLAIGGARSAKQAGRHPDHDRLEHRDTSESGGAPPSTQRDVGGRRRLMTVSLGVLAVAWIGPVAHELGDGPSNVRAVADHLLDADEPGAGWGTAWGIAARQLAPISPWAGGPEPVTFLGAVESGSTVLAAPFVVLFGWAGWRVHRRDDAGRGRDDRLRSLWILVAAGLVVGLVATSRITGLTFTYLVRWWWVLAMAGWVVIVLVAASEIARMIGGRRGESEHGSDDGARGEVRRRFESGVDPVVASRVGVYASVVAVAAVGIAAGVLLTTSSHPSENRAADAIVGLLSADAIAQLDDGTYAVRYAGSTWPPYFYGIANELDRAGLRLIVPDEEAPAFGHARTMSEVAGSSLGGLDGQVDAVADGVIVVATGLAIDELAGRSDHRLLAEHEPLDVDDRRELVALQRAAVEALDAVGRDDPAAIVERASIGELGWVYEELDPAVVDRLAELLAPGDRVAVFLVDVS